MGKQSHQEEKITKLPRQHASCILPLSLKLGEYTQATSMQNSRLHKGREEVISLTMLPPHSPTIETNGHSNDLSHWNRGRGDQTGDMEVTSATGDA